MGNKLFEGVSAPLSVKSKKTLEGLFAVLDTYNQNTRIYPSKVYKPAYESLVPKISERRLMGELDHPVSYDEVRLSNVSHLITECEIRDNGEVYGKVELLDTPAGLVAQALVEAGIPLGISSRGLGTTKKVREGSEVTSLKLITYDLVSEPSFSNAILNESLYNGLHESLTHIEESLPLNESVETEGVRSMITKIRESVKVAPEMTDEEVSLFESELMRETDESLSESIALKDEQIASLEGLVEARNEELAIQSKVVKDQMRIIESLKSRIVRASEVATTPEDFTGLIASIGQLTLENADYETRLQSLEENMESLQEEYNNTTQKLTEARAASESATEEVVTLRKRLAVESRGLSWKKYGPILEGLTTDREISTKLDSITHLSNSSSRLSAERLAETLTESQVTEVNGRRLSNIISRV